MSGRICGKIQIKERESKMKGTTKKALSLLLAAVMVFGLIMPYSVSAFASGAVINVTSEQELKQALNRDTEVSNINIVQSFTVNSECNILYDNAHINNYHDTVMTIENGVTLTIANGGAIGSLWPSYEGDRETPPLPNGKIINNGTVIVEDGGATEADFDTNNGDILVKDGGSAVCCNTNNGTVVVEDGGKYATTQGAVATNNGNIVIHQGAMMESRFGTKIVNAAGGSIELNGQFRCGCIGDAMWFENHGTVSGNGDIILYEAAPDFMPLNNMDALIADLMGQLGQSTRFEDWDDVFIFRSIEVSDFASLKAATTGQRVVAGEKVEGDMDTLITLTGSIEIPEGESIGTMARLTLPEGYTLTVNDGAMLECGLENFGTVNVLSGGEFATTQGGRIENHNRITVGEGAELRSQMGGEVFNYEGATLALGGTFYCGCIGDGRDDGFWFDNQGAVSGNGDIILYEADHDIMPVNDMDALIVKMMGFLGQTKRFENWEDINIYKLLEASDFASLKAALPKNRTVAGERVEGNMDTIIALKGNVDIPEGESIETMARLTLPEGYTLTVNKGALLECGIENNGTINVLSGGNFFTTQGGDIYNNNVLTVNKGATIKSQMGGRIVNLEKGTLTLDGTCYVGCIGVEGYDRCWFNNFGTLTGGGSIVLYEAAHDELPVSNMGNLAQVVKNNIGVGEGIPTVTVKPTHVHAYKAVVTAPKANALGYTEYKCACGEYKKDGAGKTIRDNFKAPTGKPAGVKCAARTAEAEKITWSKTAGVSGYQVQISNAAGNKWATAYNAKTATSYTFSKLTAGSNYKFRVRFYIKADDGNIYYGAWSTISSPTLPKATKLTSATAAKKAFTAQWKKGAVTGYQLQYSTNKKFTGAKTITIKKAGTLKYTVSKLAAKRAYYVRIRTYKTINKVNYYSAWSAAKAVKTK